MSSMHPIVLSLKVEKKGQAFIHMC
jgi:hypothetical protein